MEDAPPKPDPQPVRLALARLGVERAWLVGDTPDDMRAARAAGWQVQRASPEGELLRLRHAELGIADLLIAGTDYQQEAIRRARLEPAGDGEAVPVLTVEDVIVHKLIAGRTQDLADVEAILAARVPFDERYVERWAVFWDVLDRWQALR